MTPRLYGITGCDSCRRARRWLAAAGLRYDWIDLQHDGVGSTRIENWRQAMGDAVLVNKRSRTWRDLDPDQRAAAAADPVPVLAAYPTLIKRPILETDNAVAAGFSPERYQSLLVDPQ